MAWIGTVALVIAALAFTGFARSASRSSASSRDPKSILVVGDSIVSEAFMDNDARFVSAAPSGYSVVVKAFMGQKTTDHLADVREFAAGEAPARLVIELGTNDALDGGWTAEDAANYRNLLAVAPARTCITVVLPGATSAAAPAQRADIADARAGIRRVVGSKRNRQIVDFADFQAANPSAIYDDGIHLRIDGSNGTDRDRVRDAYRDWLFSAVNSCSDSSS